MIPLSSAAKDLVRVREILRHPASFTLAVVKGFRANQGFLLAGAVAYYTLLSLVPALILVVIALHKLVDETLLLSTLGDFLEFAVPGQAQAIVSELTVFLANHEAVGGILLVTMLFFSALAFTVLENAMSVIFYHRVAIRRRRFLVSALMPYVFIVFLAFGLLIVTFVAGRLDALAAHDITVFGQRRDFSNLSAVILYVLGVVGEILLLSGIYLVMPVGRLSWAPRAHRRYRSRAPLGDHAPHPDVVLRDDLADPGGLRLADQRHRGAAERGDGRARVVDRRAGDRGIRAQRPRSRRSARG